MTDRPILFSAPMVRALLAGRKTQTRRPLYTVRGMGDRALGGDCVHDHYPQATPPGTYPVIGTWFKAKPGDRLWVRETWGLYDPDGHSDMNSDLRQKMPASAFVTGDEKVLAFWRRRVAYRATWQEPRYGVGPAGPVLWRPSIHMPRWISRIALEVTDKRVERLQDISPSDALAEGVWTGAQEMLNSERAGVLVDHVGAYRSLWEHINGPGTWADNPWVVALTFKRITP